MFMVGDTLWLEYCDIVPENFTGRMRFYFGSLLFYKEGQRQSFQDPVTGEWMPAFIRANGTKFWYDKDQMQSFQDPVTRKWMPAVIHNDGTKAWYDNGDWIEDPEEYFKNRGQNN